MSAWSRSRVPVGWSGGRGHRLGDRGDRDDRQAAGPRAHRHLDRDRREPRGARTPSSRPAARTGSSTRMTSASPSVALDEHRLPLAVGPDDLGVERHRQLGDRVEPRVRAVAREHLLERDARVAGPEQVDEPAVGDGRGAQRRPSGAIAGIWVASIRSRTPRASASQAPATVMPSPSRASLNMSRQVCHPRHAIMTTSMSSEIDPALPGDRRLPAPPHRGLTAGRPVAVRGPVVRPLRRQPDDRPTGGPAARQRAAAGPPPGRGHVHRSPGRRQAARLAALVHRKHAAPRAPGLIAPAPCRLDRAKLRGSRRAPPPRRKPGHRRRATPPCR